MGHTTLDSQISLKWPAITDRIMQSQIGPETTFLQSVQKRALLFIGVLNGNCRLKSYQKLNWEAYRGGDLNWVGLEIIWEDDFVGLF